VKSSKIIGIIEKSGTRMLNIINDIISISKIESQQIEVSVSETNVNEQLEYIYHFFKLEAEQKNCIFL
jgi:signal transduction histidine kinase